MPEIGATLREARMRARIDISEIESQTKIRAKYLRALENEEWDLLPGPTYVKSFLRTYGDALHLDGKRLVEEYKLQNERLTDVDLQPIAPPGRRPESPKGPRIARGWFVGVAVLVLIGALYLLGRGGGGSDGKGTEVATTTTRTTQTTPRHHRGRRHAAAAPARVHLQLRPTAPVWVCLVANGSRRLIPGTVLQPGQTTPTYRSKRLTMTFGNGSVTMRVNGKALSVPASANPIGYALTPAGRQTLDQSHRPTCGQ